MFNSMACGLQEANGSSGSDVPSGDGGEASHCNVAFRAELADHHLTNVNVEYFEAFRSTCSRDLPL